jgi:hypothetical protein
MTVLSRKEQTGKAKKQTPQNSDLDTPTPRGVPFIQSCPSFDILPTASNYVTHRLHTASACTIKYRNAFPVIATMTNCINSSTTSDLDNTLDTAHPITAVARVANTTSTDSFTGLTEEWLTIKLTRDEAVLYLIAEILEWFKERGIDVEAERARRERVSALTVYADGF